MSTFMEFAKAAEATAATLRTERAWKQRAMTETTQPAAQRAINAQYLHELHMAILYHEARAKIFMKFANANGSPE